MISFEFEVESSALQTVFGFYETGFPSSTVSNLYLRREFFYMLELIWLGFFLNSSRTCKGHKLNNLSRTPHTLVCLTSTAYGVLRLPVTHKYTCLLILISWYIFLIELECSHNRAKHFWGSKNYKQSPPQITRTTLKFTKRKFDWPGMLFLSYRMSTSFPGSPFSAFLSRWNRDLGCGWSRDYPESGW